jgi:C-terminal processing protease CtpA/Prc
MMDKSWDTVLSESVLKFISADDISLYHKAIIDMAVATNDGHAATNLISYPTDLTEYFTLVDSNTVVRISPEQSSLERGDIILKVGNKEIWNIRDSIAVTISSSNIHYTNYRVDRQLYDVIRYASDITILRKNIKLTVPIKFAPAYLQKNKRDMEISSSFKKISNETGYVNLDRLKDSEVSNMFDSMKNTKGIILDLRNYPRHSSFYDIICYLSSKQQHEYLQFTLPDTLHPGAFYWRHYAMSYSDEQIVNSSKYVGKIVVLIFENTMSSAETTAVMYRTAGNAILIGRPTAGANGNAAKLLLPNKVSVFFSGYGAYYPDRTEIQRKGVIPDIEVYPDMQSIMAGKDEILEAAISYIENL